jgi:hypothetical protein
MAEGPAPEIPPTPRSRRRRRPPSAPAPKPPLTVPPGTDALVIVALAALAVVGLVVVVDILANGTINPSVLALFISMVAPLIPALLVRIRG